METGSIPMTQVLFLAKAHITKVFALVHGNSFMKMELLNKEDFIKMMVQDFMAMMRMHIFGRSMMKMVKSYIPVSMIWKLMIIGLKKLKSN
jgi:hypothetical protein